MNVTTKDKTVTFICIALGAKEVFLAGDFNNWSSHALPLKKGRLGKWTIKLTLPKGEYEYKFIIDDQWSCDPSCPGCEALHAECRNCVSNAFGSMNRVIVVE